MQVWPPFRILGINQSTPKLQPELMDENASSLPLQPFINAKILNPDLTPVCRMSSLWATEEAKPYTTRTPNGANVLPRQHFLRFCNRIIDIFPVKEYKYVIPDGGSTPTDSKAIRGLDGQS